MMRGKINSLHVLAFFSLTLALFLVVPANVQAQQGEQVSLQSHNFPDRYVKWTMVPGVDVIPGANFGTRVELIKPTIEDERRAASFRKVQGLAGGSSVSFQSMSDPNWYLRHQGYVFKMHPNDNSELFKKDASFYERPPLDGVAAAQSKSYEAVNFPGHYFRHQGFVLKLHQNDNSPLFAADASFVVVPSLWDGRPWQPGPVTAPENERSVTYRNIETQIKNIKSTSTSGEIDGTYSTYHMRESYTAGTEHVQGIAQLKDGRYVLSHNTRGDIDESLMIFDNGSNDTIMKLVGRGNHPGGIQAAGYIVVVPIIGGDVGKGKSEIIFIDASDKNNPVTLKAKINHPKSGANAAGIAYHPGHKRHYVIVNHNATYGKSTHYLYRSGPGSLTDANMTFELVDAFKVFGSQGGAQLLYEDTGNMYIAALYRTENDEVERGIEHITLSRINGLCATGKCALTSTELHTQVLSDSGDWFDYGAGFRWGGTIGSSSTIEATAVARTLAHSLGARYAKIETWNQSGENEYRVQIDCNHSDLDYTDTANRITVSFLAGSTHIAGKYRDGVSCPSIGADPEFEITSGTPITRVTVSTNGSDAFYIDELRIYKDDVLVTHEGRDNGSGWCLSTDPGDAQGSWKNNISGSVCRPEVSFYLN